MRARLIGDQRLFEGAVHSSPIKTQHSPQSFGKNHFRQCDPATRRIADSLLSVAQFASDRLTIDAIVFSFHFI